MKSTRKIPPPAIFCHSSSASARPIKNSAATASTTKRTVNRSELQKSLECSSWLQLASVVAVSLRPLSVLTLLKLISTEKTSGKTFSARSRRTAGSTNGQPLRCAGDPARLRSSQARRGAAVFPGRGLSVRELAIGIPFAHHDATPSVPR